MYTIKTPLAKVCKSGPVDFNNLVPAGLAQKQKDYYCPDCNCVVRRRDSSNGVPHFYHLGDECLSGGLESAIHLMTKQAIEELQQIWLPNCKVYSIVPTPASANQKRFKIPDHTSSEFSSLTKEMHNRGFRPFYKVAYTSVQRKLNYQPKKIYEAVEEISLKIDFGLKQISEVRIEKWLDGIRPDIIATIDGKDYLIEIANTHKVDKEKLKTIQQRDLPTIEIDVSHLIGYGLEAIKSHLVSNQIKAKWLHYSNDLKIALKKQKQRLLSKRIESGNHEAKLRRKARNKAKVRNRQLHIRRLKQNNSNLNKKSGLPVISGHPEDIAMAFSIREDRLFRLGRSDYIVQVLTKATDWLILARNSEVHIQYPNSFPVLCKQEIDRRKAKSKDRLELEKKAIASNQECLALGLPVLISDYPMQIINAIHIRAKRVAKFGINDEYVQRHHHAEFWITNQKIITNDRPEKKVYSNRRGTQFPGLTQNFYQMGL